MDGVDEVTLCETCGHIMGFSVSVREISRCPNCGAATLGFVFRVRDGSLLVWDEEIEKKNRENIFLRCIMGFLRKFL